MLGLKNISMCVATAPNNQNMHVSADSKKMFALIIYRQSKDTSNELFK
jgi:hypothetical protein